MPKLSKIRLTGCKYDGLRKKHENSIFDLTKDEKADHVLFTLFNGGGKGVMMQLIFQLLLPETRWGKNNGNKVISMFYDQRNNLHPFTFHVALEWVLDTVPEKRLISGIAVKAVIKNTGGEEEEKTGLSYFLYTHEYEKKGYFTIENLPLFDKEAGEAIDMDEFESFIDDHKRDFIKYSQSSVKRKDAPYYSYLESRGIYRSEWVNLKAINKSEGGAGDYFIGASDNKSIFDKIILPAISENIKNYTHEDSDNLIEMFKSNLSITKDLPVLMKREGGYKDLLVAIKPLIENADSGSRFIDRKDRLIDEGNDIYFILKEEEGLVTEKIRKWSAELSKAEAEGRELDFQKDNLNYNKQKKRLEEKEKEIQQLKKIFIDKLTAIEEKKAELELYKINELLYAKGETEVKTKYKVQERQRLVEALDISDIKERARKLDDEILQEWEKTTKYWRHNEDQYRGYIKYTDGSIEDLNSRRKKYEDRANDLQNEINKFQLKEEDLDRDRKKLEAYYDLLSLAFPERILEDLKKVQKEITDRIVTMKQRVKYYQDKIAALQVEINSQGYQLEHKAQENDGLQEKIKRQEEYELNIARSVAKQLMENYDGSLLTHHWFGTKLEALEHMEEYKKEKLVEIQRAIWEKNIDKALNKEEYFIPNKDVLLIKEEIEKLGIHVETGTEYIKEIDNEERLFILKNHPGFIYSVVIGSEREWQLIEKNIGRELLFNSMVPIYMRSRMKEDTKHVFNVVTGKAYDLIEENKFIKWKENMTNEVEGLSQTEISIKVDLKNIAVIKQELNIIAKNDTAWILNQRLREQQKEIAELTEKISKQKEEMTGLDKELSKAEYGLDENEKELDRNSNILSQVENYIEKLVEINKEKLLIEEIKNELKEVRDIIITTKDNIESIQRNQRMVSHKYAQWKAEVRSTTEALKEVINEAVYEYEADGSYLNEKIPELLVHSEKLTTFIKERKVLEADISAKNKDIAVLDTEIKHLREILEGHIKALKKLTEDWQSYPCLNISLNEILITIEDLENTYRILMSERDAIKSRLDTTTGSIKSMMEQLEEKAKQIQKDHQRAPIILVIEDIDSRIDMVERDIKSNKKYLEICTEELQKNQRRSGSLEINLTKIKTGYPLEVAKGRIDEIIKEKIQSNPDSIVEEWLRSCEKNEGQIRRTVEEGEGYRNAFIKEINLRLEEDKLKEKVVTTIKEANINHFKSNLSSFKSMEQHFQQELLRLSNDKKKAEDAMKKWTNRASIHIIRMVEALKSMVSSMNYINEQGYAFPLVKLKGIERLPKDEGEIAYLLDEYFVQAIGKILERNEEIKNIEDKAFKDLMGDMILFSKALQGRYPTLLVYKMSEKNEFRFARARDEYYTTWEAINKGEGDLPEGSGGQTLSVNTFVIMMIMSFKKKRIGNENPSTVLVLDNPFGKASAKHVLDPIFEIADKLNFQLICFAAPEIIKVEISERFPIFWELKLEDGKVVHGGRIIK